MLNGIKTYIAREPVLVMTFVQCGLAFLMAFGLHLSVDQVATTMALTAALLGLLARSAVTPLATLPDHIAAAVVTAANASVEKIQLPLPAVEPR